MAIILSSLLLVAYVFYKPVLKNADKPFIELSGAVGNAVGNAESAYIVANPTPIPEPVPTPPVVEESEPEKPKPKDVQMEVVVGDEKISFGAIKDADISVFKSLFESGTMKEKKIILVDDYAESGTFNRLIKLFKESGTDFEIEERVYDD